jgi:hypothetical protein
MWITPMPGDRFRHASTPEILIADRATRSKAHSTRYLWCQGNPYPLAECEPYGIWQTLAGEFVADLEGCTTYPQIAWLLDGLADDHKKTIWDACPIRLRAKIHQLKNDWLPSSPTIEFTSVQGVSVSPQTPEKSATRLVSGQTMR